MQPENPITDVLVQFDRLLPIGGVCVYPEVRYIDSNDVSVETRLELKRFLRNNESYKQLLSYRECLLGGTQTRRKYGIYVYRKEDLIGALTLVEILDNPEGYGENDFYFGKIIWPKYRYTKYSRYAASDLFHMVFKSNLANNLYSYFLVDPKTTGETFWDRVDRSMPCLGILYSTDGPDVQKYMILKKEVPARDKKFMLLEFNGDIYRSMDLKSYFMNSPGRTEEVVDKWLKEMDGAANKVIK